MESLAAYLRSVREKKKISLEQIAAETRITLWQIKSIDEGQFHHLPGGMYNRAMLRSYCESLGLDPADVLARYEAETTPQKDRAVKSRPKPPLAETSWKPHPSVVWSATLLISVIGLYLSRRVIADIFSPYFSHPAPPAMTADMPPAQPSAPAPREASPTAPSPAPTQDAGTQTGIPPNPPPPLETGAAPATEPLPAAVQETAPAAVGEAAAGSNTATRPAGPPAPGTIRIEFQALQPCWVTVLQDGNRVLGKTLEPGEEQSFDATEKFFLVLGNAGGVRLKINGRPAKPLGKPGEVVRVLINEQSIKELIEKTSG